MKLEKLVTVMSSRLLYEICKNIKLRRRTLTMRLLLSSPSLIPELSLQDLSFGHAETAQCIACPWAFASFFLVSQFFSSRLLPSLGCLVTRPRRHHVLLRLLQRRHRLRMQKKNEKTKMEMMKTKMKTKKKYAKEKSKQNERNCHKNP